MASGVVLGSPQKVGRPDGSSYDLPDPLLSTILDFVRRALDQLARALRIIVVRTRNHRAGIGNQNEFFRWQDGECVDPSRHASGHDVYYLLKNLASHVDVYASALEMDSPQCLTSSVEYLLQTIRNQMAHQSYLECESNDSVSSTSPQISLRKYSTVKECLDECIKLLAWFINAPFYKPVRREVGLIQTNLSNMKSVVCYHQIHKEAMERVTKEQASDTGRAAEFLRELLRGLEAEESRDSEPEQRPITHAVNTILAPRIELMVHASEDVNGEGARCRIN